jgi:hypothetical protein
MSARDARIQTALGCLSPRGFALYARCKLLAQLVEPTTRGFSVDSASDSLFESMS